MVLAETHIAAVSLADIINRTGTAVAPVPLTNKPSLCIKYSIGRCCCDTDGRAGPAVERPVPETRPVAMKGVAATRAAGWPGAEARPVAMRGVAAARAVEPRPAVERLGGLLQ